MDNKNEKTFADLFSSSTENEETKNETFSDILNTDSNEPLENETPNEKTVTFDNIFDHLSSEEENTSSELSQDYIEESNEKEESSEQNTFNSLIAEEDKINTEESIEQNEGFNSFNNFLEAEEDVYNSSNELQEDEEQSSFDDIFKENQNKPESNIKDNNIEEETESLDIKSKPEEQSSFSDIFNENKEISTEDDNQDLDKDISNNEANEEIEKPKEISTSTIFDKQDLENEKVKTTEENANPFFSPEEDVETEKVEENSTSTIFDKQDLEDKKVETTEENANPFFSPEIDVETEKIEDKESTETVEKTSDNPFFNPEVNDKVEKEPLKTSEEDANPFFKDEINNTNNNQTEVKEEQTEQENPFFASENNNQENEQKESSSSILNQEEPKINIEENELPKSTSPFFQEEEKPEQENPFFQQQINLIENQTPNNPTNNIDLTNTKHYDVKIVKKKEPLIKLILGVLSYAMFIFLLLIGIALLVYVLDIKIRQSKGDYSAPTFNAYVVLTGSMLPEIQVKDVVVTKKIDPKDLKEGDVITFASTDSRFAGTIITHRIIKKNPKTDKEGYTFQTKGDNNNVADSALVTEGNIFGKVILKIPKLGYLQEFLAVDGGWIIVILIPCLVVISYDIVKLAKGLKRKKYKNIKVQK